MSWTYEQDFESLSVGNLAGQDSWTAGSGTVSVTDTLSYGAGTKSVLLPTNLNAYVKRNIDDFTDDGAIGYVSVYANNNTTGGNSVTYLWDTDGAGRIGDIYLNGASAGKIYFRAEAGTWYEIATYSINTWYRIGFEFDFTNNRIRFNIDGGAFGSWFNWSTARSRCGFLWLGSNGGGTANNHYWDAFSASYDVGGGGPTVNANFLAFM